MSVFDEFTSAYTRFRMAAEYNGHLWHCLLLQAQGTDALSTKHRLALFRELRSRLMSEENAEHPITQLVDALASEAHEFVPEKSGGRPYNVVDCPWSTTESACSGRRAAKKRPCSGPDGSDLKRDCRAGFRAGLHALRDLIVLADIVGIAREQARRYDRWPPYARPDNECDLDALAWEALGEGDFIDGCLSPRTLSHLDLALLVLMANHDDLSSIQQADIVRIIRNPQPTGGTKSITICGRFGSIVNAVWDKRFRKERRDSASKPVELNRPHLDSMVANTNSDQDEAKEFVERVLGQFSPDQQAALLFLVKRQYEDGANLKATYEEAVKEFGLSAAQVKALWRKFKHRLLSEGES